MLSMEQKIFLFSFFFFSFSNCAQRGLSNNSSDHVKQSEEEQSKQNLAEDLNLNNLKKFLDKYPGYINRSTKTFSADTARFYRKGNRADSLAFYLIQKNRLDLARFMAQRGDTFNDAVTVSCNPRILGSTPLIVLAFIQPRDQASSQDRHYSIKSMLENNPYALFEKRDDGMTAYLTASIKGDLTLMNLLEESCSKFHSQWLVELRKQKTYESLDNSPVDFLKYSISRQETPENQRLLFSKLIEISNFLLENDHDITIEKIKELEEKIKRSLGYLSSHQQTRNNLHSEIKNYFETFYESRRKALIRVNLRIPIEASLAGTSVQSSQQQDDDIESSLQLPLPRSQRPLKRHLEITMGSQPPAYPR